MKKSAIIITLIATLALLGLSSNQEKADTINILESKNLSHVSDMNENSGILYMGLKTMDGGVEYGLKSEHFNVLDFENNHKELLATPLSLNPASACALSACGGSGCAGSVCGGSACIGSACGTSGCIGSACGGSGCGGSACGGTGCFGSGCAASDCGGGTPGDLMLVVNSFDFSLQDGKVIVKLSLNFAATLESYDTSFDIRKNSLTSLVFNGEFKDVKLLKEGKQQKLALTDKDGNEHIFLIKPQLG